MMQLLARPFKLGLHLGKVLFPVSEGCKLLIELLVLVLNLLARLHIGINVFSLCQLLINLLELPHKLSLLLQDSLLPMPHLRARLVARVRLPLLALSPDLVDLFLRCLLEVRCLGVHPLLLHLELVLLVDLLDDQGSNLFALFFDLNLILELSPLLLDLLMFLLQLPSPLRHASLELGLLVGGLHDGALEALVEQFNLLLTCLECLSPHPHLLLHCVQLGEVLVEPLLFLLEPRNVPLTCLKRHELAERRTALLRAKERGDFGLEEAFFLD
mmetsp:Transcript_26057/g.64338  ORF Transcript_26057/g.64338 Transcript_26057/m.64338 type:complete len:271 (-) Transcript_26057:495-1307(-)